MKVMFRAQFEQGERWEGHNGNNCPLLCQDFLSLTERNLLKVLIFGVFINCNQTGTVKLLPDWSIVTEGMSKIQN